MISKVYFESRIYPDLTRLVYNDQNLLHTDLAPDAVPVICQIRKGCGPEARWEAVCLSHYPEILVDVFANLAYQCIRICHLNDPIGMVLQSRLTVDIDTHASVLYQKMDGMWPLFFPPARWANVYLLASSRPRDKIEWGVDTNDFQLYKPMFHHAVVELLRYFVSVKAECGLRPNASFSNLELRLKGVRIPAPPAAIHA